MKVALICFSLTGQQTGERLYRGLEAAGHHRVRRAAASARASRDRRAARAQSGYDLSGRDDRRHRSLRHDAQRGAG